MTNETFIELLVATSTIVGILSVFVYFAFISKGEDAVDAAVMSLLVGLAVGVATFAFPISIPMAIMYFAGIKIRNKRLKKIREELDNRAVKSPLYEYEKNYLK